MTVGLVVVVLLGALALIREEGINARAAEETGVFLIGGIDKGDDEEEVAAVIGIL